MFVEGGGRLCQGTMAQLIKGRSKSAVHTTPTRIPQPTNSITSTRSADKRGRVSVIMCMGSTELN